MNIMFVGEKGDNPSAYYRCELPAAGLQLQGHTCWIAHTVVQRGRGNLGEPKVVRHPDVLICRRMLDPYGMPLSSVDMFRSARKFGQRVYVDIDDDMWHLPTWNPAREWVTDKVREMWVADANAADGVIVATPELGDVVREQGVRTSIHVCEAGIDARSYRAQNRYREPLRLAWIGAVRYRGPDLASILRPLRKVLKETSTPVEFWHLGGTATESILDVIGERFPVPVSVVPWQHVHRLPLMLESADAALIPMTDEPFNRCRSATIGLACMAAGVPYVASAMPAYERMWNLGGGYIAHDEAGWEQAIRTMIEPEYVDARRSIVNGGLAVAHKHNPRWVANQYWFLHE